MKLGGQGEGGYAMATLLVGMALMAIFMSVALPAWSQMGQREKEAEYLFRANQYAIAIKRFQAKMGGTAGNGTPAPSVDFLVEQRFLRKKYKDPLTGKDFVPVLNNQALPGANQGGTAGALGPSGQPARPGQPNQPNQPGLPGQANRDSQQAAAPTSSLATGKSLATDTLRVSASEPGGSDSARPLTGVTSSSKATALRLFKGQATTYDQWALTAQDVALHLGGTSVGTRFAVQGIGPATPAGQGQPGQPGQQPGTGTNPFGQPSGSSPFGQPSGTGVGGTGGFGSGAGSGFGQPSQQGTPVFPQPPFGGGQGSGARPPGASPFGSKPPQ